MYIDSDGGQTQLIVDNGGRCGLSEAATAAVVTDAAATAHSFDSYTVQRCGYLLFGDADDSVVLLQGQLAQGDGTA